MVKYSSQTLGDAFFFRASAERKYPSTLRDLADCILITKRRRKIKTLKIIFVIIGTLVGAGYASGREILTFFNIYGLNGLIGLIISNRINKCNYI